MEDSYIGVTKQLNIVKKAYSNIDSKYGPYDSIEDALSAIPISLRKEGLTVGILVSGTIYESWFNGGVQDENLIPKGIIGAKKIEASPDTALTVSAAYSQVEVQAILDELHDLKNKMRLAGILAVE